MTREEEFGIGVVGCNDLEPISLTEHLLNKCSFNFKELGFEDLSVSYGITSEEIHFVIGNYYHKLDYLHQIKNLYYCLTGKELTIKE